MRTLADPSRAGGWTAYVEKAWLSGEAPDLLPQVPPYRFAKETPSYSTWETLQEVKPSLASAVQKVADPEVGCKVDFVVLLGPPGTGKTCSAWAILQWLVLRTYGRKFGYELVKWTELLNTINDRVNWSTAEDANVKLTRWHWYDYLVLDEFADSKVDAKQYNYIKSLIDSRYENKKLTIITSNADFKMMAANLQESVVSRLNSKCSLVIEDQGADKR